MLANDPDPRRRERHDVGHLRCPASPTRARSRTERTRAPGSGKAENPSNGNNNQGNQSEFGFGISGDVGVNYVTEDINAWIGLPPRAPASHHGHRGRRRPVAARSEALLVSGIGALAANNNGGIAGAFALNEIHQTVTAFVAGRRSTRRARCASPPPARTVDLGRARRQRPARHEPERLHRRRLGHRRPAHTRDQGLPGRRRDRDDRRRGREAVQDPLLISSRACSRSGARRRSASRSTRPDRHHRPCLGRRRRGCHRRRRRDGQRMRRGGGPLDRRVALDRDRLERHRRQRRGDDYSVTHDVPAWIGVGEPRRQRDRQRLRRRARRLRSSRSPARARAAAAPASASPPRSRSWTAREGLPRRDAKVPRSARAPASSIRAAAAGGRGLTVDATQRDDDGLRGGRRGRRELRRGGLADPASTST